MTTYRAWFKNGVALVAVVPCFVVGCNIVPEYTESELRTKLLLQRHKRILLSSLREAEQDGNHGKATEIQIQLSQLKRAQRVLESVRQERKMRQWNAVSNYAAAFANAFDSSSTSAYSSSNYNYDYKPSSSTTSTYDQDDILESLRSRRSYYSSIGNSSSSTKYGSLSSYNSSSLGALYTSEEGNFFRPKSYFNLTPESSRYRNSTFKLSYLEYQQLKMWTRLNNEIKIEQQIPGSNSYKIINLDNNDTINGVVKQLDY